MSEITTQSVTEALQQYDYPITAAQVAQDLGVTKKEVNSFLYRKEKSGKFEQLKCIPPLWRRKGTSE